MCHYNIIHCDSCKAITQSPPVFCDKILSGIICTKYSEPNNELENMAKLYMATIYEKAYDVTKGELQLYDIMRAEIKRINNTVCSCESASSSSTNDSFESCITTDYLNDDILCDDFEVCFNNWISMGEGIWDNNGGSPQWIPDF